MAVHGNQWAEGGGKNSPGYVMAMTSSLVALARAARRWIDHFYPV